MKELPLSSSRHEEMIDITDLIQDVVSEEKVRNGHAIVYVPHTTAGITINEGADPSVQQDIIISLHRLIPTKGNYDHEEGNSDAHIKASILGSSVTVFISNGRLVLGTWQHIFFFEGDGPRQRKVLVKIIKE